MLCLEIFLICDLCVKDQMISGMKLYLKRGVFEIV